MRRWFLRCTCFPLESIRYTKSNANHALFWLTIWRIYHFSHLISLVGPFIFIGSHGVSTFRNWDVISLDLRKNEKKDKNSRLRPMAKTDNLKMYGLVSMFLLDLYHLKQCSHYYVNVYRYWYNQETGKRNWDQNWKE